MMHAPGLFDLSDHLARLSATGDPLEALERHVDFEAFRTVLMEALGYGVRAKGGLTTKIHGLTDAMGLPLRLIATGGHCSEMTQAAALLAGFKADHVLADKGYDGRCVIDAVNESGAMPVIPSRKNARKPRQTDMALYKERNIVERFFGYLKQFRRVATRYDKHIQNYMGFVYIAAIKICLK